MSGKPFSSQSRTQIITVTVGLLALLLSFGVPTGKESANSQKFDSEIYLGNSKTTRGLSLSSEEDFLTCDHIINETLSWSSFRDLVNQELSVDGKAHICIAGGVSIVNPPNSPISLMMIQLKVGEAQKLRIVGIGSGAKFRNEKEVGNNLGGIHLLTSSGHEVSIENIQLETKGLNCITKDGDAHFTLRHFSCRTRSSAANYLIPVGVQIIGFSSSQVKLSDISVRHESETAQAMGIVIEGSSVLEIKNVTYESNARGGWGLDIRESSVALLDHLNLNLLFGGSPLRLDGSDVQLIRNSEFSVNRSPGVWIQGSSIGGIEHVRFKQLGKSEGGAVFFFSHPNASGNSLVDSANVRDVNMCFVHQPWSTLLLNHKGESPEQHRQNNEGGSNAETFPFGSPFEKQQNISFNQRCN